jgi:hypothetical protein
MTYVGVWGKRELQDVHHVAGPLADRIRRALTGESGEAL